MTIARRLPMLAALALLPGLAAAVMLKPVLLALPLLLALLVLALRHPVPATGLFLFAHVATPIYLRPPVPVLSNLPYATNWMLAVIGVGVLAWLAGRPLPPPLAAEGRRAARLFALLPLAALVSLLDPATNGESFKMFAIAIFFPALCLLLILGAARRRADIVTLQRFLIAGGIVASLYALVELLTGANHFLNLFEIEAVSGYYERDYIQMMDPTVLYRAFSVYLNPIEFGAVMAMILPIAVVGMATAETGRDRALFALAAAILAMGVLLSVSRGPLLSLAVVCVILGLVYRRLRLGLAVGLAFAALALVAAWPFIGDKVTARFNDADNVTLRLKLFQVAIATFLDHPLNGVGIGNFPAYYLETIRAHHIGPFHELGGDRVARVRVAENAYLQLAAEMGVIGIAAAVAAVAALLRLLVRHMRAGEDERGRDIAITVLMMAVVYGINALTVTAYTLYGPTLLMLGVVPAFALVLDRAAGPERPAPA